MEFIIDNYNNPEYILNLDYSLADKLIKRKIKNTIEKEKIEKRWQLYLTIYPYIITGKLKPLEFSDFCKNLDKNLDDNVENNNNNYQTISDEEMLREIEKIEKEAKNKQ